MNNPSNADTSYHFDGFQDNTNDVIRIQESFFTELLPNIETLHQLKMVLYLFWHAEHQKDGIRSYRLEDLESDPSLVRMTGGIESLGQTLADLLKIGVLLEAKPNSAEKPVYFINSPQGREAIKAIQDGKWQEIKGKSKPIRLTTDRPNIYQLYEENIGAITPMISEILKEDEQAYPKTWIEEAIRIAMTRNVRNWKYIQAILKRWQTEGRGNGQYRRDDSQDPNSYRESWLKNE